MPAQLWQDCLHLFHSHAVDSMSRLIKIMITWFRQLFFFKSLDRKIHDPAANFAKIAAPFGIFIVGSLTSFTRLYG